MVNVDDGSMQAAVSATRADMFNELRARVHGAVILPDDPGYDEARRVYNAMIDHRPAVVVTVAGTDDVVEAVSFANRSGLALSVRGGGHGVAGNCVRENGLVIDLSQLKGIEVDPEGRVVRAEGGVKLGELITATERYGLVTPTGTASDTGIAGLTLGGGFGYLCGKFGMAVDNLVGAEVVTADGRVRHVSEHDDPDLFWALRGGSGNFGVVTTFDLRLHPLPQILGGLLIHPFTVAREVLRFYRDVAATAPDELTIYAAMLTGPDGHKAVGLVAAWSGDMAEGERVLAPIRTFGPPVVDLIHRMPYSEINTLVDEAAAPGQRCYWKQSLLRELSDEAIDLFVESFERVPSVRTVLLVDHVHGAAHRVSPDATAFPHRNAPHGLLMLSMWNDAAEDATNIAWTRELSAAANAWSTGGVYVNEPLEEKASAAFGENLKRLIEIKQRYDPTNLFQSNLNFGPTGNPRE